MEEKVVTLKKEIEIFLLSLLVTGTVWAFQFIDVAKIREIITLLKSGSAIFKDKYINLGALNIPSNLFVIFAWILIAIFCYGVYYFFSVAYFYIYNSIILKGAELKIVKYNDTNELKRFHRVFTHLLLVPLAIIFLALIAVLPYLIFKLFSSFANFLALREEVAYGIIFLVIDLYFNFLNYYLTLLKRKINESKLQDEHVPIETEEI